MEDYNLVRPSRDGDQFHYLRAARLCLELLPLGSDLVAVVVEGVAAQDDVESGLAVIDLALYRGSLDPARATRIHYRQFKHSTRHAADGWTASGLEKTLCGFAARYTELVERYGVRDVAKRFAFEFETNRPIAASATGALADLAAGTESPRSAILRGALGLEAKALKRFIPLVRLLPCAHDFLIQRELLDRDFRTYLPDNDRDAPLKLKELVTRKATTEFASDPRILRQDVLEAAGATPHDLFPAPLLIETPPRLVAREQLGALAAAVANGPTLNILQADGGEGKSIVATQIGLEFDPDGATYVYDCFGNGGYRSSSEYRHRPRDGLVQLANQMAADGLCDLLIPTDRVDAGAYMRAFHARVTQASEAITARGSGLLCLVIDAADNAEMQAEEIVDGPSFPRLLLRETWPANVRFLLTARPHRVDRLQPPPGVSRLKLETFSLAETAMLLREYFPTASDQDVREFHRLTSRNPRVQAAALDTSETLPQILAGLGPSPRTVEDTINALLEQAVARVRDAAPGLEKTQIDRACAALATLRPFVPLEIVAAVADIPIEVIRSFANDLQRPLLVREDAIQFRDEPTETWFRERFRPRPQEMAAFVSRLRPLCARSPYAAAVLPQLMLEAGQFDALVALALSGEALPENDEISRRDVELQRLLFALKAALRVGQHGAATKLALKAGGEMAADERQQKLISGNTDLAARFIDANQLVEQVSRRLISGGEWPGSNHAYEAALLSGNPALAGDARSRLRLAHDWLTQWARSIKRDDRPRFEVSDADIVELLMADLNLHGAAHCASQLRRWRPREISYRVGRLLVARLADVGRLNEIDQLASSAGNDVGLLLAVAVELATIGRAPPEDSVRRATALLASRHFKMEHPDWRHDQESEFGPVSTMVAAALHYRLAPRRTMAALVRRYLPAVPPRGLAERFSSLNGMRSNYLRARTFTAALVRRTVTVPQLAYPELRKALKKGHNHDPDGRRFSEDIGSLLPWHRLVAELRLNRITAANLPAAIGAVRQESKHAAGTSYRDKSTTADEIAQIWTGLLVDQKAGEHLWKEFDDWRAALAGPLFIPTLTWIVRRCAHGGDAARAVALAAETFALAAAYREEAESKAEGYVSLARAVLPASEADARAYFDEAIRVSGRIGNEYLVRWEAMTHLADVAGAPDRDAPQLAYRFARAAELTYVYVVRDKHFDWEASVDALVGLSPRSAPAILSRWADRRFGHEPQLLPVVCNSLVRRGALCPLSVAALFPFRCDWDAPKILSEALETGRDPVEREAAARWLLRYFTFDVWHPDRWTNISASLDRHGIAISVDEPRKRAELKARRRDVPDPDFLRHENNVGQSEWDEVFAGVNPLSPADLRSGLERYRALDRGFYRERFFEQLFVRTPAGQEAAVLDTIGSSIDVDLFVAGDVLKALPAAWTPRPAITGALQRLVKAAYRTDCARVSANRYHQLLPYDLATRATGLSRRTLVGEAVEAIGDSSLKMDADDLFCLVGLLAELLQPDDALNALDYALDLLEPALESKDGDGDWSTRLEPPADVSGAIAGYVWAALSSPVAARRWEAAHVVRGLCRLGCGDILASLAAHAQAGDGGAFVDAQLFFYAQHARLWLIIGLARAAPESSEALAPFRQFIDREATRSNFHVLIRGFAADILLELNASGTVSLSPTRVRELARINHSQLPPVRSKGREHGNGGIDRDRSERAFLFGHDFTIYWLGPLARRFGLSNDEMEARAEDIIRKDWNLDENGHWDRDARATRQFFRDEWRRSQGEPPHIDNLSHYLSSHATYTLAGKLLESTPVHEDEDEEDSWYSFPSWLRGEGLSAGDGTWLFDRRDPTPLDYERLADGTDEEWVSGLSQDDVWRALDAGPDATLVSASLQQVQDKREQTIEVHCALVMPDRAQSLGRALQSAPHRHLMHLPRVDDHAAIDQDGYRLQGWIAEISCEEGFDRHDPWAEDLSRRLLAPAPPIREALGLEEDSARHVWRDRDGTPQLWLNIWSEPQPDKELSRPGGKRLVASNMFLESLVNATGLQLIFEVIVERRLVYRQYDPRPDKERPNAATVTCFYIFQPGVGFHAFPAGHRPRRKARRRARSRG